MKVDRSTVYRFKKRNPDVVKEAIDMINEMSKLDISPKLMIWENFLNINTIMKYKEKMIRRRVGDSKIRQRLRAMWFMCKYLNVHPMKASPEQVAEIVVEMREKRFLGEKIPVGLSYLSQREAWRGYFTQIKGISGEILTDLGMSAEASMGFGKFSKQRLTKEQRHSFEKALKEYCREREIFHLMNIRNL